MELDRTTVRLTMIATMLFLSGCKTFTSSSSSTPSSGSSVVQASHTEGGEAALVNNTLAQAEDLYRREEFAKALDIFESVADDTKNRPEIAEKARFYQAECLRRQSYYPKAVDAYHKLLQDFQTGLYRSQAVEQMYLIASEWLQPVREEIENGNKPEKERRKKSWTDSIVLANFDKKLPTFDAEGRALQTLERVYFNDPTGPYADKALFMLGRVNFQRGEYRESARFFKELVETNDRSPLRDKALEMAIIAKNNSSGGPAYDPADTSDAMKLINMAKATSPELVREKGEFLDKQSSIVRYQQAEKTFETAEFYRRTGHPGSAWFYYELVKRRFPNINPWYERAIKQQQEIKADYEDMKGTSVSSSTRRIWKEYVLGHEVSTVKTDTLESGLKELPENRNQPTTPTAHGPATAPIPQDFKPR